MDHTEAEVSKHRNNSAIVRANLYNQGLRMPGVEVAYQSAILVGAGPWWAFEAARRHELVMLPEISEIISQVNRSADRTSRVYEAGRRVDARNEALDRIRNLPNPYTPVSA